MTSQFVTGAIGPTGGFTIGRLGEARRPDTRDRAMRLRAPGVDIVLDDLLLDVLHGLLRRGEIVKSGISRNAEWSGVPELL